MIYAYLDKPIKANNVKEFLRGTPHVSVMLQEGQVISPDASMVMVHGVLRGGASIIQQAQERGIPWIYMDNAGHYFPEMYKRVTINGTAPTTFRRGKRFEHNTELRPWRGGQGKYIVVLPPSPPYMDAFGCRDFLNYLAHNVNIYTDKEMIIRAKPAKGKKARPWDEQLEDAYAVITWGSALALDAMIKGVPTISLGWCPAKMASFDISDLDTDKLLIEPPRMDVINNLTWSTFRRDELPHAFQTVIENSKCDRI